MAKRQPPLPANSRAGQGKPSKRAAVAGSEEQTTSGGPDALLAYVREDHAAREKATTKRSAPPPNPAKIHGAKKGILPVFVEPALVALADVAPSGPGWVHEIKFDGYRLRIDGSKVKLLASAGRTASRPSLRP